MSAPRYVELQCVSHFSFLHGASSADALFARAAALGIEALAITDHHSLAGIVRAHVAARAHGVRLIVGCRLDLSCGMAVLVYPTDRPAYARLCRLLSLGKRRAGKGRCLLHWADLAEAAEGLVAMLVPGEADAVCAEQLHRLADVFGRNAFMALTLRRRPNDALRLFDLANLATQARVGCVATNDVRFATPAERILQDVLTCIRHGCTIDDAGFRRERYADRHLKPPREMARLFARHPEAFARGLDVANLCRFSLDELTYQYPREVVQPGCTPQQTLEQLTWEGAASRYPSGVPEKVVAILRHELGLIAKLDYAPYFLTVNAIVRFARSQGILCQGRGSAANSAVCYVLGITAIDPDTNNLLFERFVSEERREPPDIDVDFEHEKREIVLQWVFNTYGRDRAALCAVVTRYRARGALRDVGRALGVPEDVLRLLAGQISHWSREAIGPDGLAELGLNAQDRRLCLVLALTAALIGTPRHLSQHPGGFVLTDTRLDELVPIEPAAMMDRQVIEWDKDDLDALKFMKVDCLALGMLSCMRRGFDLLRDHKGIALNLATIPAEDPATYAMIRRADTVGVFQIESRAQMSMLPRMKPATFYDLVIEVAIVRPGPIQGDMVHPYLRRREGREPVFYPTEALKNVLGKTLGVPLFQEQAMRVAIECAGFSPGEADQLRRAMATFKHTGTISNFHIKLVEGMAANGYGRDFAEAIFRQLEGFGSYGFPESHAASFALIAYASSWLKCHHPDVFCAALLNAQPMGFYAPAQIVRDARGHGVEVRPVCVSRSRWDCTLEPVRDGFAVRLGLRMVAGIRNADAALLLAARGERAFTSMDDLWRRAGLSQAALVVLAEADAFLSAFALARREALWAIKALPAAPLPLFAAADSAGDEPGVMLRAMPESDEVVADYAHLGLSLRAHPLSFLRDSLRQRGLLTCVEANTARDGRRLSTAGLVLMRQRPGSAKGVMFITIEDETGITNLVVWQSVAQAQRQIVLGARLLGVRGRLQREGEVVHLVAEELTDLSPLLAGLAETGGDFPLPHGRGDEFHHGIPGPDPRGAGDAIKVKARDFR